MHPRKRLRTLSILLIVTAIVGCATPERPGEPADGVGSDSGSAPRNGEQAAGPEPTPAGGQPGPGITRLGSRPVRGATSESSDQIEGLLAAMSFREIVAQRFITYLPSTYAMPTYRKQLLRGPIGGVIIYPWNYGSLEELEELVASLDEYTTVAAGGIRPFVAADQEGGRVRAIRSPDILQLPAAYHIGRHANPDLVEAIAYANGTELRRIGINLNFAPVLDLHPDGGSTIIGDRSFGGDPELVGALGRAYLQGSARAGIICVPKHFPGHGVTRVDSHGRLPVSELSWPELRATHGAPFAAAIEAGAEAIMTAHILFPAIDPDFPVTLSRRFLDEILRGELGFDGVIISDAIEMGAISQNFDSKTMLRNAFSGGVDIILVHQSLDAWDLVDMTIAMVELGYLAEDDIVEGTRRVLSLKNRYGLLPGRVVP